MNSRQRYTDSELEQLRTLFKQKKSDGQIAETMGRSVCGIAIKRRQLGLHRPDAVAISIKKGHKWTDDDLLFIRNYWREQTDRWMAKKLGVSVSSYKHKSRALRFSKTGNPKIEEAYATHYVKKDKA